MKNRNIKLVKTLVVLAIVFAFSAEMWETVSIAQTAKVLRGGEAAEHGESDGQPSKSTGTGSPTIEEPDVREHSVGDAVPEGNHLENRTEPKTTAAISSPVRLKTVTLYSQDFESSDGSFTHSGTENVWKYGNPDTFRKNASRPQAALDTCNSGTKCWTTDLDSAHKKGFSTNLVSRSIVIPAGSIDPTLSWAMKYHIESLELDRVWVDVSNGSLTEIVWEWNRDKINESTGESPEWGVYTADLKAFASSSITVTFHIERDASVSPPNVAIDDLRVTRLAASIPVTVSGRLTSNRNRGVGGAQVSLNDGITRRVAVSDSFGYYKFDDVLTQQKVLISVTKSGYTCPQNEIFLSGAATSNVTCS